MLPTKNYCSCNHTVSENCKNATLNLVGSCDKTGETSSDLVGISQAAVEFNGGGGGGDLIPPRTNAMCDGIDFELLSDEATRPVEKAAENSSDSRF